MVSSVVIFLFLLLLFIFRDYEEVPVLDKVEPFVMNTISQEEYNLENDKVKLVTFFYTKCPDVCAMTMYDLQDLQLQLQKEDLFGKKVELLSITLDPENDSNEVIRNYANAFDANDNGWKFIRGTTTETKEIAGRFKVKYKKISGDFISHSTVMYLVDEKNRIRGIFDMANAKKAVDQEKIMETIKKIME